MTRRRWISMAIGVAMVAAAVAVFTQLQPMISTRTVSAELSAVPAPAVDEPVPAGASTETVVLAGGCFWGVQGVFEHVKGVTRAESGYAGGQRDTANYETVSTGDTGHAESVQITYDPKQVTYGQLLQIYFSVVQDPTQLNRQGPDEGSQYRSAIFAQNDTQKRVAAAYIAQLTKAAVFPAPIVTTVSPKAEFFPAEQHHQDFLNSNPTYPYIEINDMPKVDGLKKLFPQLYRDQPVLVLADGVTS
ncbi:MAG: peptide-methionine (S)-S-oxide reductase MsrA [Mycobacterium sp.]